MKYTIFILSVISAGLIGGIAGGFLINNFNQNESAQSRIRNFYEDEMATVVSPQTVKEYIDKNDDSYILVDLRSKAEYDKEHIKSALNIPAVSLSKDQIIAAFQRLPKDKQIIVHCYSFACTLGRQIGRLLSQNNIFVKEMDVGWNEWRYHWDLWNIGAGPLDGKEYIVSGATDPNAPILPCTVGEFSC